MQFILWSYICFHWDHQIPWIYRARSLNLEQFSNTKLFGALNLLTSFRTRFLSLKSGNHAHFWNQFSSWKREICGTIASYPRNIWHAYLYLFKCPGTCVKALQALSDLESSKARLFKDEVDITNGYQFFSHMTNKYLQIWGFLKQQELWSLNIDCLIWFTADRWPRLQSQEKGP
jgi:hypothetical protein